MFHNHSSATSTRSHKHPRYAYAFIIGSIHENRAAYKGFLYNVLLAVDLLRKMGSTADYVLFAQASPDSNLGSMPLEDQRLLDSLKIRCIWLPRPKKESFSDLMFDKFRVLRLVEYDRVLYMDADVLPISNLDYFFALSDPSDLNTPTILLPNVMQASSGEPANGGLFMIRPDENAWEQLQDVIAKQREDGKQLPYPNFHRGRGWGHKFRKKLKDNWHAASTNGTNWVFHGAHADQGLLYYFFRFVLQNASAIVGRRIENWVPGADAETPIIGIAYDDVLRNYSHTPILQDPECTIDVAKMPKYTCFPPYRDFIHFTGKSKPWQNRLHESWNLHEPVTNLVDSSRFWFAEIKRLHEEIDLKLDFDAWNTVHLPTMEESPLGYHPLYRDNTDRIFDGNETYNDTAVKAR